MTIIIFNVNQIHNSVQIETIKGCCHREMVAIGREREGGMQFSAL